ncbi:MAG: membrane dipeptidase [Gemmatimonadota bacterium]|nr:membrane dipeptidase [Gemmatimonadota bacterium]
MFEVVTKHPGPLTRRAFLGTSAGVALAATASGCRESRTGARESLSGMSESGSGTRDPQSDLFVINMLGGIRNPNIPRSGGPSQALQGEQRTSLDDRALADAIASGTAAVNTTIGYVAGPREPFESSVADISRWNRIIRTHPDALLKVWAASDIERAAREGRVGIIQGFQNAAMMGDDAQRVGTFAGLGVRIIQLTYNVANQLGHGSMVPENGGLTDFGRDVVAELNATNTLVDLSHSGEQTCLDAIDASAAPLAITHTGCRAVTDLPRNKTDRELRLVAEGGGIVGIYFMPFLAADGMAGADDVVRHIEHAVQVCGEEHVGIGTDGGTTAYDDMDAAYEAARRDVERRRAAGIGAAGERAGVVPFIPDLQGPDQFRKLSETLLARGHATERVEKILGTNALRVMREVWGA